MKKNDNRLAVYHYVDKMFYSRDAIKKAVEEARFDSGGAKSGGSGHAFISDPTAKKALKNISGIPSVSLPEGDVVNQPEEWLHILEHVYNSCNDLERKLVDLKYRQQAHYIRICEALKIEQNTYYYLLKDIKAYAVELACQKGLVRKLF